MDILITGAYGMVGTALKNGLMNIRDGKNRTRPALRIDEIYLCGADTPPHKLARFCESADFVFHLAGVNRPERAEDFMAVNAGFTRTLTELLKSAESKAPFMLASSVQASLCGRFVGSEYGRSKRAAEDIVFAYGEECGVKTAVYRFPNIMGHSRPNYNSAVSTFCHNAARGLPMDIRDTKTELELLYICDLVEGMFDLLEGKEARCEVRGSENVPDNSGRYCYIPTTHTVTLGETARLLTNFSARTPSDMMPKLTDGSFEKKLYSLYLTYLPRERFAYPLHTNSDARGSFTELLHTPERGQVSVNISKPGALKGEHWHSSKWELFIVVHGHGLIRERNIDTGETVEFEVTGERIEAVCMIPGWTHSIYNLSATEDLVTVMICNENFDPAHPDTYYEPV